MRIAEISDLTGLSIDTIRFYDKSGMLPDLPRDARGWRCFTGAAREWLEILGHLRRTGMPTEDMRAFASSVHGPGSDDKTEHAKRLDILRRHAERLIAQRKQIEACEAYLNHKISIYSEELT